MTKMCNECGIEKILNADNFHRQKNSDDGFSPKCKSCTNKARNKWRESNPQKPSAISEEKRIYYREYARQYYKDNKQLIKDNKKIYYEKNRQYMLDYQKQWDKDNPEYRKNYQKENLQIYKNNRQKYRMKKKQMEVSLTPKQWEQIKKDFNYECAYCGMSEEEHYNKWNTQLHQEHFIALNKGGEFTHNNVIPSCKICNSSKHDIDFFKWYPTSENYSKKREKLILEYLNYKEEYIQQLAFF